MANWLIEGLTATISGVLTVFVVLILIAFLISQLKHMDKLKRKNKKEEGLPQNSGTSTTATSTPQIKEDKVDDLALVAVITAALAASLNTTTDKLVVRSIRRVDGGRRRR